MKLKAKAPVLVAVVLLVAALFSCAAEPPKAQVQRARAALAEARDVTRAHLWAPDEFSSASAAMDSAEAELTLQNRRFSFARDYAKASELFTHAAADLEMARRAALAGKQAAEKDAREALEAATSAIGHAQAALMIAPVSRDRRSSFGRLEQELEKSEHELQEVRNLIVAEQYKEAIARAEQILAGISSMLRTVGHAVRR